MKKLLFCCQDLDTQMLVIWILVSCKISLTSWTCCLQNCWGTVSLIINKSKPSTATIQPDLTTSSKIIGMGGDGEALQIGVEGKFFPAYPLIWLFSEMDKGEVCILESVWWMVEGKTSGDDSSNSPCNWDFEDLNVILQNGSTECNWSHRENHKNRLSANFGVVVFYSI